MEVKSLFLFDSYKPFLSHIFLESGQRGRLAQAARAIGCERSYLSRVLSEKLNLTPDHAFNLAQFLSLSNAEQDYFMALVELERAVSSNYRRHWEQRVRRLKEAHNSVANRASRTEMKEDPLDITYFSAWTFSAVHVLTSIPEFQSVRAIANHLGLSEGATLRILERLREQGLVQNSMDSWTYLSGNVHVPKSSPKVLLHHQNWRSRAVLDAQDYDNGSVHYTAVQSVSREDAERIKEMILECIEKTSRIAAPSESETGIVFLCDYFKV